MNEELDQLVDLIELAKGLDTTFKNTLAASMIPSVAIVGGVFMLHFSLSTAIAFYMAGMGLSVSNAMLPLLNEFRRPKKEQ